MPDNRVVTLIQKEFEVLYVGTAMVKCVYYRPQTNTIRYIELPRELCEFAEKKAKIIEPKLVEKKYPRPAKGTPEARLLAKWRIQKKTNFTYKDVYDACKPTITIEAVNHTITNLDIPEKDTTLKNGK